MDIHIHGKPGFRAATQVYIIHKVAPRYCCYAIQIGNLVFVY